MSDRLLADFGAIGVHADAASQTSSLSAFSATLFGVDGSDVAYGSSAVYAQLCDTTGLNRLYATALADAFLSYSANVRGAVADLAAADAALSSRSG